MMATGKRTNTAAQREIDDTVRLFQEGLTPRQIADRTGVLAPCVRKRLIKAGLWKSKAKDMLNGAKSQGGRPSWRNRVPKTESGEPAVPIESREPCTFCGVRTDIGCSHTRRPSYLVIKL